MDERMRAWSIVALGLLSAILIYILVRTPPSVRSASAPAPAPQVHAGPVPRESSGSVDVNPDLYRGWPLFLGWPLPEVPTDWGTGGSGQGAAPAPAPPNPKGPPPQGANVGGVNR